jgi:hypothetical protein
VSGPKISCSRSAGFEKGISRYALKHAPPTDGKKTERRNEKLKIRGVYWHFDETAGFVHVIHRRAGIREPPGADAPIYARVNVTIPKPTSYYWEPMQLMWL